MSNKQEVLEYSTASSARTSTVLEDPVQPHATEYKSQVVAEDVEKQAKTQEFPVAAEVTETIPDIHPDGGFEAWLVCAGVSHPFVIPPSAVSTGSIQCLTGTSATFGLVNAWGVSCAVRDVLPLLADQRKPSGISSILYG